MPLYLEKNLRQQIIYVVLLPAWFVLHGNNDNYGLVPLKVLVLLFFKYLLVTAAIFIFSWMVIKENRKVPIFGIILFSIYFLFGYFHDLLRENFEGYFISSYTFLLSFLFGLLVISYLVINQKKFVLGGIITFIKWLVFVLFILELSVLVFYLLSAKYKVNILTDNDHPVLSSMKNCAQPKPDIYFIVLDEYASSASLLNDLHYDNHRLDSLLISNHFFISEKSNSNYNVTPFSLASTFELSYLKKGLDDKLITSKLFMQAVETFNQNQLIPFLEKNGYSIFNYGCFHLKNHPTIVPSYFEDRYESQIDNQTLYSRIMRDLKWHVTIRNVFTGKFRMPGDFLEGKKIHLQRNETNWKKLTGEIQRSSSSPKFVYTHIMLPHEPFFLKADGSFYSDTSVVSNKVDFREGFLNQVGYTNRLLQNLVPQISKQNGGRGKVVIIEGDHGFRFYTNESDRPKEFKNLNAYYFSDNDYKQLYDGISPVNSFRVVLNKYFCQSLPLLKDSSIYIIHDK
jgi:hypothetical protein